MFQSVWVGDSLLGKPRMESIALLGGDRRAHQRVRLGPACMASFPLRDPVLLAYQWASLDLLSGGRTVLVVCTGIVPQEGGRIEGELYGLQRRDRVQRMLEWIELVKLLWTEDNVTFEGRHYRCEGITIEPKPAAKPRRRSGSRTIRRQVIRKRSAARCAAWSTTRMGGRRRCGTPTTWAGACRNCGAWQPRPAAIRRRSRPTCTTTST